MISWIQRYFQHHFRIIFAVLLAVIIVAFVFTIGAAPGIGRADRAALERRVFGYNLGSQEDQERLFGDAGLSAQLQTGYAASGPELQEYGLQRAATLTLADELHIPASTKQEVTDHIKGLRVFLGQDGQFDAQRYATFRDSLKNNPRLTEDTVFRVMADDVRITKVQKLLAGPGYVLPADVKRQLEQAEATWTLGVAKVDYASFQPNIPTSDAILTKFFDENSFRYEVPPRIVVSYAEFPALSFVPSVNVSEAEVRAFYDSNPARFPKAAPAGANAAPKVDPAADFAAVRPQVETALKLDRARNLAAKAASDLSYELYERKLSPGTAEFDAFLSGQKIALKPLAPFTREQGPAEFGGSPEVAAEAFKLNESRSYSDAVPSPTGAVVLFWKDLQPARKPQFGEVRERVAADYIEGEKRKRFVELGRTLRTTIENRLKAGDSFEAAANAAASAQSVKVEAKMLPAFSRRQPPQDLDYSVFGALERLEKGRVSDMVLGRDQGLIVYAAEKKLPDLNEASPQFSSMRDQVAMATSRLGASAFLNDWIADELKKSEPATK
ncbi:MAG TPA: peptidyl-prolyl cis-trans isomerase [Opitutus sp.]|nr:peptidyl-prolyl cis-trans isomerase [Opitutus sp.]